MSKHGTLITVAGDQEGANPQIVTPDRPFPVQLYDALGNPVDIDGLGHMSVVAHAHEEGGHALFEKDISFHKQHSPPVSEVPPAPAGNPSARQLET